MAKQVERMSYKELQELSLRVKKAMANVQDRERVAVRLKMEALAASAGFKIGDLFGGRGGKGRNVSAKYANPDDPSQTWSGRGRKPNWLLAKLKKGASADDFAI